jgi:hypothetical protein
MRIRSTSIALAITLSASLAFAQAQSPNQTQDQTQSQVGISPDAAQSTPAAAPAQQDQRRAPDPARMAKHLGKQLGLTRDQVAQIQPILANRQQQLAGLRDGTMAPKDRRAKMRGIVQDSQTQIEALLTDSQKQQYEQMLAARRAAREQKPANAITAQ